MTAMDLIMMSAASPPIIWSQQQNALPIYGFQIVYGAGLFVVFSNTQAYATSPDGATWTTRTLPYPLGVPLTYRGGQFIYITGTKSVISADGINWTLGNVVGSLGQFQGYTSLAYGSGVYVTYGQGLLNCGTSTDGLTWTSHALPNSGLGYSWTCLSYGNGIFLGGTTGNSHILGRSPDGMTWTATSSGFGYATNIIFGKGVFVLTDGNNGGVATTDGTVYFTTSMPTLANANSWGPGTFGGGQFVILATGISSAAATSPDGIHWTRSVLPSTTSWRSIAYGNGIYIALNGTTTVATLPPISG